MFGSRIEKLRLGLVILFVGVIGAQASAVDVRVTVRNLVPSDSIALSPINVSAHNGSVDQFSNGNMASAGVEDVAELGGTTVLPGEVTAQQASAVTDTVFATLGGFGPGIFLPSAEGSIVLSLDPADHRYFSFLSMVVPSNDAFIGNDSPMQVELFDAGGTFLAPDFTLTGANIWDAGTEVNGLTGALYVVGQDGAMSPAEGGTVHPADLSELLGHFTGEMTPPGATFNTIPSPTSPIASFSFTLVPEPTTAVLALLALGGLAMGRTRSGTRK